MIACETVLKAHFCNTYRLIPVAFRRQRGAAEDYGKDELREGALYMPLKATGYESEIRPSAAHHRK